MTVIYCSKLSSSRYINWDWWTKWKGKWKGKKKKSYGWEAPIQYPESESVIFPINLLSNYLLTLFIYRISSLQTIYANWHRMVVAMNKRDPPLIGARCIVWKQLGSSYVYSLETRSSQTANCNVKCASVLMGGNRRANYNTTNLIRHLKKCHLSTTSSCR